MVTLYWVGGGAVDKTHARVENLQIKTWTKKVQKQAIKILLMHIVALKKPN